MSFRESLSSTHAKQVFLPEASPVFRKGELILIPQPASVVRNKRVNGNLAIEALMCFYHQCTDTCDSRKTVVK